MLDEAYRQSKSVETFYQTLHQRGLKLYFRGTQPGIIGKKRKYRLKTLGYSLERIQLLSLTKDSRDRELERMVAKRLSQKQQNQEHEQ